MQEDDGQCAFALVCHMKADAIGCDVHGKAIFQSLDRPLAVIIQTYAFDRRAIIHLALSSSDTGGAKRWIAWKA